MEKVHYAFNPGVDKITIATYDEKNDWWVAKTPESRTLVFWTTCEEDKFYLEVAELTKEGVPRQILFTMQHGLIWDPWENPKRLEWGNCPGTKLWCDRIWNPAKPWPYKGDMEMYTKLPMMFWTGFPSTGIIIIPGRPEPEKWHLFLGMSKEEYDESNRRANLIDIKNTIAISEQAQLHYAENQEQKEQTEKEWEEWEKRQAEGDDK